VYNTRMTCLPCDFFLRSAPEVARALLGMRLVRDLDGRRISGTITETEAYNGEEDLACHARSGKTTRNAVMYGPPGRAYVYFTYGMHWCLNVVTGAEGSPAAVLLRAILPLEGLDLIDSNRKGVPENKWTDGPAKLCKAMAIDGSLYGTALCETGSPLRIEQDKPVTDGEVVVSPRVGIQYAPEPWLSKPWRFRLMSV
jgi:DNA-3-methyladenine glycosylase